MRGKLTLETGLSVGVVLTALSLAIYYRGQAVDFQQKFSEAQSRLDRMTSVPAMPDPIVVREEVVQKTSVAPQHVEAKTPPSAIREPEFQSPGTGIALSNTNVTASPRSMPSDRFGRRSSDWIENLRTNDPQRYAEVQQRRQQTQQNIKEAWGQANTYFMNRDISRMPQEELEEFGAMLTFLGRAASLNQQLQSGLPPEVRQQVASDLRSNVVAVVPLLENERNREYYDAAVAMGQSEQDAAAMVGYINRITSNTSLRVILPGVRVGGMPGGAPFSPGSSQSSASAGR